MTREMVQKQNMNVSSRKSSDQILNFRCETRRRGGGVDVTRLIRSITSARLCSPAPPPGPGLVEAVARKNSSCSAHAHGVWEGRRNSGGDRRADVRENKLARGSFIFLFPGTCSIRPVGRHQTKAVRSHIRNSDRDFPRTKQQQQERRMG
ncbi:hypothetical protein F2P81_021581 [Scophthalmus maximus]|uniref:Uncharacterized protein n=1 Tax=Scophthalmus maximus TaxID=52904 RepID=A0A6A4S899_SCOMX|nr:hypothetical protein F2P81_021581 [Scophthalmus maximus]